MLLLEIIKEAFVWFRTRYLVVSIILIFLERMISASHYFQDFSN